MRLRRAIAGGFAGLLLLTAGATTAPSPPVGRWFARLADPDPAVRDDARQSLMGLSAEDLPQLLDCVRAARPLLADEAASLHEIVCQAYLAADPYEGSTEPSPDDPLRRPPHYVMGVRWPTDMRETPRLGVPVVERWAGFPAGRLLRDGDLIRGVYIRPDLSLQELPNMATNRPTDLQGVIQNSPAVHDIVLSVLRDGRDIRVPMTLVPQPAEVASGVAMAADTFVATRRQRAETYWQDHFAALAGPPDGTPDVGASVDP